MAMASNKNSAVASPAKEPLFEGLTIVRKNLQSSGKALPGFSCKNVTYYPATSVTSIIKYASI
jgi:hypothetical protein